MPHVERSGVRVHYESFGSGPPLVLLHPMATNRYFWAHALFRFARDRRVLVLDHRGHGLSDRPADGYAIADMAADLLAVLDHAGVDRAALVGCSLGGMIALQAALDAPARVSAVVVTSSATNLAPHVPAVVRQAYAERFEDAFAYMLRGATSARTKRERPEVDAFLADVLRAAGDGAREVFLASMRDPGGVFDWDASARLAEARQPVLVLAGAEDQAVPLEAVRALAAGLPHATFRLVPDVAHVYPLERPADFADEVRAFLERTGA